MRIDGWTLALQAVNVLVLLWLLSRFALRPIAGIIAARQAEAARLLDEAAGRAAEAEAERSALASERAAIAALRSQAEAEAARAGEAQRAALLAAAANDADAARAAAHAQAAEIVAGAEHEVAARARALAVAISARLLARAPGITRPAVWLPGLVAALPGLGAPACARLATGPLTLTAAGDWLPEDQAACLQALGEALGAAPPLSFASDPALIAGLELAGADTVVRNHLAADLAAIAGEPPAGEPPAGDTHA